MSGSFKALSRLDDSRNLSQWIQYTTEHSPEHPLFAYSTSESQAHIVTRSQVAAAVERAALLVDSLFNITGEERGERPPVIGILANLDSITYNTIYLGVLRAGGTVFLLSTRNSPAALAHLLEKTGTHKLLVSADKAVRMLVSSALALARNQDHIAAVHMAPDFQTLFEHHGTQFPTSGGLKTDIDAPAVIIHSSGSSSFPKPIMLTHRTVLQWTNLAELVGIDLTKTRFAIHALPVYHGMGFFVTFWAVRTGMTLTVFPPQFPPVVPSHSSSLWSAVASQSTFMLCVPLFLELWNRETDSIEKLKRFRGIVFSGGPLNKLVGDELVRHGVRLSSFYGATEIGPGTLMVPLSPGDNEWEWLQLSPFVTAKFLPQEGCNTFELVYLDCPTHCPFSNTTVDGKRAFSTNDIVIRHPTDPQKFKVLGRKDDQIMLSSGEKTNPGPMESIICRHPFVEAAVMFGRARAQNGIIIQPAKGHEFDPTDTLRLYSFRNDIWSSVEQANALSPSHSRLFKEMIVVTYPSRPIEMTAKYTPRRAATLEAYKDEIEAVYNAVQASMPTESMPSPAWGYTEALEYTRKVVHHVMNKELRDDADIFEEGCDSLRATYIRRSLAQATHRALNGSTRQVSQDIVYTNPTIVRLTHRVLSIFNASPGTPCDDISVKQQEMEGTISNLSTCFPKHRPTNSHYKFPGEVILLTGTTGGLGSQLLAYLALSPEVSRVYALNRRPADPRMSLRDRQVAAFGERGLDDDIIDSPKVVLVEGDTGIDGLDIDPALYSEIRDTITLIIHNAWRVNFNLEFESFKCNIQGVRTLIDLALGSPRQTPPRIIYTSSVAVFKNWNAEEGRPLETSINDLRTVLGNGYGESKFVGERILENAAKSTPLRPIIVRIGQVTGTSSGAWSSRDWVPAIVRSGQVVGVLPARRECIAWISLETAAQAIFDFRHSESQYLHLAHPNPVSWGTVFEVFSSRLNVPLVSWNEWFARLLESDGGEDKNPAVYLRDFFHGFTLTPLENAEAPGIPLMDLTQALKSSPTLVDPSLPQVGRDDAERWLRYWEKVGLLSNISENF